MAHIFYHLYIFPLILSVLAGIRAFRYRWPEPYRYFLLFLVTTLLVESFAIVWKYWLYKQFSPSYNQTNGWLYNLYFFPQFVFYLFFYFRVTGRLPKQRNTFFLILLFFVLAATINMVLTTGIYKYNTNNIIIASLLIVFLTTRYFLSLFRSSKLVVLQQEPLAWISFGAFIYHLCCIPYFTFFSYLNKSNLPLSLSLYKILTVLNVIMYSSYTIAFLCRKTSPR